MSWENETFRKAARDAGIRGKNWRGSEALDEFSTYYHDRYDRWEREKHGYSGILAIAQGWWNDNNRHYS